MIPAANCGRESDATSVLVVLTTPKRPQIWKLHRRTSKGSHPDQYLEARAERLGTTAIALRKSASPSRKVLETDPLA